MALKFERRHLTYRTWFHKRHWGGLAGVEPPVDDCCILMEDDPGDGSSVILLEDGSGCIEPEDCTEGSSNFLFLSDPADEFEFLSGASDDFMFLQ